MTSGRGIGLRRVVRLLDSGVPFVEGTVVAVGVGVPIPVGYRLAFAPGESDAGPGTVHGGGTVPAAAGPLEGETGIEAVDRALMRGALDAMKAEEARDQRIALDGTMLPARRRYREADAAPGTIEVAWQPHVPAERLVIIGAGHVAVPLCALASTLGYAVTVIDDRARFATPERFPGASEVVVRDMDSAVDAAGITRWTNVVLVTRGHEHDESCLERVAASAARYVGMIGSRRRVMVVHDRLRRAGVPGAALDRVHAPIGLDLGGRTPAEIALAIIAEIVMVRRGGRGGHLSERRPTGVRDGTSLA